MRPRRVQIVALALIGAIINVAVAWLCAYYAMPRFSHATTLAAAEYAPETRLPEWARGQEHAAGVWTSTAVTELDLYAVDWNRFPNRRKQTPLETARALEGLMRDNNPNEVVRSWLVLRDQLHEASDTPELPALRCDAGWPLRSLRGWGPVTEFYRATWPGPQTAQKLRGPWSVILIRDYRGGLRLVRVMPLQPLMLGFAINTILYAVLAGAALFGATSARRALRARRGLCRACGYDLRGAAARGTCPECGYR